MSKTLHTTGLLKSVTVLSLATGVVFGGKYIIDMNKPSPENKIISSTNKKPYQDTKNDEIVENNNNSDSNSKKEEKTVPKTDKLDSVIENNQHKSTVNNSDIQVLENNNSDSNSNNVSNAENNNISSITNSEYKNNKEEVHNYSQSQPELPVNNNHGNSNYVPNEAPISEKGEPLVQPELPEAVVSEKGEPLVQPELPEAVVSEKGEPAIHELTEFNGGVNPNEAPSVDVPEYKIKTVKREDVTTLTPSYVRMANMKLNEGETQITHNGKNGSLTKVYEDIVGEDGKILKSTLLSENRVEPEIKVIRYGTKKSGENLGETGLYRLSEHTKDIDIVAFNQNIKLNGNEMKSLGQNELYKRSQTDIENNLFLAGKPGWYIIANAPLSEESIKKLNDGSYINHKNVGKEMLKLVNEERKRVGKKTLKWSNGLYELSKIRAKELGENGNIRYYNSNNEELKHSRDENGTKWFTVAKGSSFQGRVLGENLAGYTLPRNIYKVFSEKAIAEQLFNQWKASKGHYANMIDSDYTEFGFDFALSSFWRTNHTNIDYLAQGLQGVQLFAV